MMPILKPVPSCGTTASKGTDATCAGSCRRKSGGGGLGEDLTSVIDVLEPEDGPATAEDVVTTLLEGDSHTLLGSVPNLLFQLLAHPDQLGAVRDDHLLIKRAWQEA